MAAAAVSGADDDIDRALLDTLLRDGRATLGTLATASGLSVSAAQARVRRLESRGVISGYSARVNPQAVGLSLAAFVAITPLDPAQPDDAPERLSGIAEIEACHSVAGAESYLLLVRVAQPADLERLLLQIRTTANVGTRTTIVLQTYYEHRPLNLVPAVAEATSWGKQA